MPGTCLTQEQADEFAIGGLDPEAEAGFAAHLVACDPCLELVRASQRLASTLAFSLPLQRPPGKLRARVLRATGIARPGPLARLFRYARATAGIAAVVVAIAAFTGMVSIRGQVDGLRHSNALLEGQVADALSQNLEIVGLTRRVDETERANESLQEDGRRDRELWIAMMSPESDVAEVYTTDESSSSIGRLIWDPEQKRVWFVATGLKPLPAAQTYQIWVSSNGRYQSLGTFNADSSGFARYETVVPQGMKGYDTALVTIEQAGGAFERKGSKSIFVADLSRFRR